MFIDSATLKVQAGRGGDGRASFASARHNPRGGPDGGDGGRGGNVIVTASHNNSTLARYRTVSLWKATDGSPGGSNKRSGKMGEDIILTVPPGTIIKEGDQLMADLSEDGQSVIVARGGVGGLGNTHFATSTFQAPRFAELGAPGEERELSFELKLIADVGLVGLPNAGKSTLLSVISSARPRIADYPFTTLVPNLGVVKYHDTEFVVADIPGLIEGASEGKGLGDAFLRHVERTRVLVHLIDSESDDVTHDYSIIRTELEAYSQALAERPTIIVLSKSAYLLDEEISTKKAALAHAAKVPESEILLLSAQEHMGLDGLLAIIAKLVRVESLKPEVEEEEIIDVPIESVVEWYIEPRHENHYELKGLRVDRWVSRTNFQQPQAIARLRKTLERAGVFKRLARLGAKEGETMLEMKGYELPW
ncbi:GTPase ObgE [Candidatus Saccharibacteria bacterium]|nr:GTPase ObgE [Candidatus Saccharibacteria bacterium]